MKVTLNFKQVNDLCTAYANLDCYETIAPGDANNGQRTIRVPFKLGSYRRILVKNVNVLKAYLKEFDEARTALIKEHWPDMKDGDLITRDLLNYDIFERELTKMLSETDEFELQTIPSSVIYGDNEFPTLSVALLDEFGLVDDT